MSRAQLLQSSKLEAMGVSSDSCKAACVSGPRPPASSVQTVQAQMIEAADSLVPRKQRALKQQTA